MGEFIGYNDEQVEQAERQTLSRAIARRLVNDQLSTLSSQPTDSSSSSVNPPPFFTDAMIDGLGRGIETAIKTPTPFAAFFDSPQILADSISEGDFIAWVEEEDMTDTSPLQLYLYTKAFMISQQDVMLRPPELKFENFFRILNQAKLLADNSGVSIPTVYEKDELYVELIKRSFSQEEYENELNSLVDGVDRDTILLSSLRYLFLCDQIRENPQAAASEGLHLDDKTIQENVELVKQNEELMGKFTIITSQAKDAVTLYSQNRINHIWGNSGE